MILGAKPVETNVQTEFATASETYTTNSTWVKKLQREDNGKLFKCSVQHEALKNPLLVLANLSVHCK